MPTLQMHSSISIQGNGAAVFSILSIRKHGCKQKRFVSKETQTDALHKSVCKKSAMHFFPFVGNKVHTFLHSATKINRR